VTDRDLDATDHLNKKMLEIYKTHLDNKTTRVPNNAKMGAMPLLSLRASLTKAERS
jgi:hypothetical protein